MTNGSENRYAKSLKEVQLTSQTWLIKYISIPKKKCPLKWGLSFPLPSNYSAPQLLPLMWTSHKCLWVWIRMEMNNTHPPPTPAPVYWLPGARCFAKVLEHIILFESHNSPKPVLLTHLTKYLERQACCHSSSDSPSNPMAELRPHLRIQAPVLHAAGVQSPFQVSGYPFQDLERLYSDPPRAEFMTVNHRGEK